MNRVKYGVAIAYILSIILGNIFVTMFGIGTLKLIETHNPEHIWFSLTFPLGAMWIGLTFSFRDFVQRYWGHQWTWLWMILASFVTWLFNQNLAYASVISFIAAEGCDWFIFYLLRHRTLKCRLVVSNLFSCPLDSILFVTIAFGVPWYSEAVWGQAIIKYGFGLLALPIVGLLEGLVQKIVTVPQHSGANGSFRSSPYLR